MVYRFIEHTADLGIEATADSLNDLFAECMRAATDCLTRLAEIKASVARSVRVEAGDLQQLLVEFLGESIYLYETQGLVFADARVKIVEADEGWILTGELRGETFELDRHGLKTLIKAVTYHQLKVEQQNGEWCARVIFDI